ncbi:MAG TPA: glycosyltransferase family 4 protein [Candidatus Nanopelagicales bacterium]|nr:glycosyltransferase family 4 protein [Candidatus Nanopelagicales bacterium]
MRILHVSWEYPPLVYGGLGHHVHGLATAQAAAGHEVVVVTQRPEGTSDEELLDGVRVVRAAYEALRLPDADLLGWVAGLDRALARAALRARWTPDVVHAHDWVVGGAGRRLRDRLGVPLVATLHATEAGRHQGWLPGSLSHAIHRAEFRLTLDARRVIVLSYAMRDDAATMFGVPSDQLAVVPSGIDRRRWRPSRGAVAATRERYAGEGPLVVTASRLEWEKGVHTLLDAVPRLRRRFPGLRVVIAGRGSQQGALEEQARRLRLGRSTSFAGWLDERDLAALLGAADAVVLPSVYEPFGLVALEAAVAGAPLVVSGTGGLAETVEDGCTGRTFAPLDATALADAVTASLRDEAATATQVRAMTRRLREHDWSTVADRTAEVYAAAIDDVLPRPRRRLVVRDGNQLLSPTTPSDR